MNRSGPIVIKIGGATLEAQAQSPTLWRALVDLHDQDRRDHSGGGLVLVHGGGKAVDRLLDKLGMETRRHEGLRITPPDQMDVIAGVLAGTLNKRLVGCINAVDGRAVGLCLGDGAELQARRLTKPGIDLGCVGEISGGDWELLLTLRSHGYLPVIACIAIAIPPDQLLHYASINNPKSLNRVDPNKAVPCDFELLNINGDDAAAAVARAIHARALVLLTDVPGVLDADKKLIPRLDADGIQRLADAGVITGGMIPKLHAASRTANELRSPVTIMSGANATDLERWAKGEPLGTTIEPGSVQQTPTVQRTPAVKPGP